jgi:hypothetical protein
MEIIEARSLNYSQGAELQFAWFNIIEDAWHLL